MRHTKDKRNNSDQFKNRIYKHRRTNLFLFHLRCRRHRTYVMWALVFIAIQTLNYCLYVELFSEILWLFELGLKNCSLNPLSCDRPPSMKFLRRICLIYRVGYSVFFNGVVFCFYWNMFSFSFVFIKMYWLITE